MALEQEMFMRAKLIKVGAGLAAIFTLAGLTACGTVPQTAPTQPALVSASS